jgi:3-methyladenine DNA glycosylase AlkD
MGLPVNMQYVHPLLNSMQSLEAIQKMLASHANPNALAAYKKFVPGAEKIYGVRMPVLNSIAKQWKKAGFELVQDLWRSGSFEEKALAAKILGGIAAKDPEKTILLIQSFSKDIDNWAVCDALGMQATKPLVKTHSRAIFALAKELNQSNNLWQRRLSLVLVEWYTRDASMHPQINALLNALENDKEYYVQKAVAWIKRNLLKQK